MIPDAWRTELGRLANWFSEPFRVLGMGEIDSWGLKLFTVGVVLILLAAVWLVVRAFRTRVWWGLCVVSVVLSPLFVLLRWKRARPPILVGLLGACTVAGAHVLEEYLVSQQLVAREKIVEGELHLTLTGWKEKDYSILATRPNAAVLQMANADVDDRVLAALAQMTKLRKLDVSGSAITDAGLERIAALPNLQELYLARTAITEDGFKRWLMDAPALTSIDLSGTKISRDAAKAWREAKPGRKRPIQ